MGARLLPRPAWLGALLGLAALELLVRQVFVLSRVVEPGVGLTVAPGSTVVWGREGHGRSHWGENGIRGRYAPVPGRPLVLVLGDSQTEAFMVDDDEVFTALADAELGAGPGPDPTVRNAGRSSASLADYVLQASWTQRVLDPAWVVLVLQESDLGADSFAPDKTHLVPAPGGGLAVVEVPPPERTGLGAGLWWLRQRSMLVGYGVARLSELATAAAAEPRLFSAGSVVPAATVDRSYPFEVAIEAAAAAYAGRVSFLLLTGFDPDATLVSTPLEARFLDHCRSEGLPCATTRRAYAEAIPPRRAPYGHANTRFNWGHLNRAGHRAVAAALVRHLRELRDDGLL